MAEKIITIIMGLIVTVPLKLTTLYCWSIFLIS